MAVCIKTNKAAKCRLLAEFGGRIGQYNYVEQWLMGAKCKVTGRVIIDVLPEGGRKFINSTMTNEFVRKTAHEHTLVCTDGARYYNVKKPLLRGLMLAHVKCNHRWRERVKKYLHNVAGVYNVGTQRCVCVCVCRRGRKNRQKICVGGLYIRVCVCVVCVCVCV